MNTQLQPLYPDLESNTLTTGNFLRLYFNRCTEGFVEITYLAPEGVRLYPGTVVSFRPLPADVVDDNPRAIMGHNQRGYSVYFGTTVSGVRYEPEQRISERTGKPYTYYQRRKEKDVTLCPAIWTDIDDVSLDEGLDRLNRLPFLPSIVVRSGGGVHAYFLLDTPVTITGENKHEFKRVLHGLGSVCGGDVKTRDLARLMRLPGTVNTKPERKGALCEVVSWLPGHYHYEQLRDFCLPFAPREIIQPTRELPTYAGSNDLPAVTQHYLDNPPAQGERNQRLYAAARGCNDTGLAQSECEALLTRQALATGLEEHEVERTISSAYDAAPVPLLPAYMRLRMAMGDKLRGKK